MAIAKAGERSPPHPLRAAASAEDAGRKTFLFREECACAGEKSRSGGVAAPGGRSLARSAILRRGASGRRQQSGMEKTWRTSVTLNKKSAMLSEEKKNGSIILPRRNALRRRSLQSLCGTNENGTAAWVEVLCRTVVTTAGE